MSRPFFIGSAVSGILLAIALIPFGCSQGLGPGAYHGDAPAGTPVVRVLVRENAPTVSLSATQPPTIRSGSGPGRSLNLSGGSAVPITYSSAGWKIGSANLPGATLTIEPASEGSVKVDGKAYRGRLRLAPTGTPGRFDVINDVDVDGYLMSVVPREMFPQWHAEAYRAQAIVARTYAIYVAKTASQSAQFDLFADTRSQVYGGTASETAKSREAIDSTRGMVVAYGPAGQEHVFKAYFSSCCGGVAQSAADAFGDPYSQPLSEHSVGTCCAESPHYNWATVTVSKIELTRRIRQWGASSNQPEKSMAAVSRVEIEATNQFGRPSRFAVTDVRGYRYSLGSEDFRHAVNTGGAAGTTIGSSFCKPVNDSSQVRFTEGHGFGHGVGLCQWCAQHQAATGVPHQTIVVSAFPGSRLVRAY